MALGTIALTFDLDLQVEDVRRRFKSAVKGAQGVVARALLADAYAYVPVLSGALRDSGRVEHIPTLDDSIVWTRVVFGSNPDVLYAEYQHEEDLRHPSLGFKGRAKYLQKPFDANSRFYLALYELELSNRLNSDDEVSDALAALGIFPPSV